MTPTASPTKRTLSTAEERREAVLEAGMSVFAERGFLGTPTTEVAKAAGISQAYLFRLFPTKTDLVLAVVQRSNDRIREAFARAAAQAKARGESGEEVLMAMGEAYGELLRDRDQLMLQLQAYAACNDPDIGATTRREFGRLWRDVSRNSGVDEERLQQFFAMGMLMNVMAAMDVTSHSATWVKACLAPTWLRPVR